MDIFATGETLVLTAEENAIAGGIIGSMIWTMMMGCLVVYVLFVIALWKIFVKAGEAGWKSLIPLYNAYIMFKIVGMKGWFWGTLAIGLIVGIITSASGVDINGMTSEEIAVFNWGNYPVVILALAVEAIYAIVVGVWHSYRLSKAFGHGVGFTLGLIFLSPIFDLILGFGKSKYNEKVALKK